MWLSLPTTRPATPSVFCTGSLLVRCSAFVEPSLAHRGMSLSTSSSTVTLKRLRSKSRMLRLVATLLTLLHLLQHTNLSHRLTGVLLLLNSNLKLLLPLILPWSGVLLQLRPNGVRRLILQLLRLLAGSKFILRKTCKANYVDMALSKYRGSLTKGS